MAGSEYTVVISTVDTKENADRIAETLVKERLAACVNVMGPISSTYWWEGKVEKSEEHLLIIKTRKDVWEKLMARLKEIHPYKVPEILSLRVEDGNKEYLAWIDESLQHG
ncbi:MAG: divalent-cation tolerance protein CutA [Thermoprotei archaeon]